MSEWEPGRRAFETAHEGFTLGPKGVTQPWDEQTVECRRRWEKVELVSFAELLKAGGVHYLRRKPAVIEASEPMDGKSDWALTVQWPDGTETVELVSTAAAALLGYHPAEGERCVACDADLTCLDLVLLDANGGFIHRVCAGPEREGFTDGEGEPLLPGAPLPIGQPFNDSMNPAHMKRAEDVPPEVASVCKMLAARLRSSVPVDGSNLAASMWLPFVAAVEHVAALDTAAMTPGRAAFEAMFPDSYRGKGHAPQWKDALLIARVTWEFIGRAAAIAGRLD